jgi:lipoprotein-anchoring transpeptidase ErfK/SrfK
VIVAIALFVAALTVPASDLASSDPGTATATGATAPPAHADAYTAVQRRGAPVAVILRRTVLRAAPRPDGRRLATVGRRTEWRSPRVLAVVGRRGQWLRVIATELRNGHRAWIPMSNANLEANPWAIAVDLSARRATVRKRGRVVRRFTVAVGRGDTPTPTGRFSVTDKLHLTGSASSAYGCCALALSGHQPKISQGWRGGDRLAIHGTQLTSTIGSAASLGCLRARDEDARYVVKRAWLGTIVEIRP